MRLPDTSRSAKTVRRRVASLDLAAVCALLCFGAACAGTSAAGAFRGPEPAEPAPYVAREVRLREADARLRTEAGATAPAYAASARLPSLASLVAAAAEPASGTPTELAMSLGPTELELPPGHLRVVVEVPGDSIVTLGLVGLRQALGRVSIDEPYAWLEQAAKEDGELPRFVSLQTAASPAAVVLDLELSAPLLLLRRALEPKPPPVPRLRDLRLGTADPRPSVGLPFPAGPADGYFLAVPHRYQFARHDVALALRAALAQTRTRFRRDALAVGDLSQWDGERPASDQGDARHIGHLGGREVDIGLPSSDASASEIANRCQPVLVDRDVTRCAPGTVKGLDALRLAYFLGLLLDGPTPEGRYMPKNRPGPLALVDSILTDEAYIDEIRQALPELQRRRWIHDEAFGALMEEGILRPSPWHVDHVHVRFAGEVGTPLVARPPQPMPGDRLPFGPTWLEGIRP